MIELIPQPSHDPVFLRGELVRGGLSDRAIAAMVRGGELHRIRHGAYVDATTWKQASREERHALLSRALLKQCRAEVVLSHHSALPEYGAPMWMLPIDVAHVTRRDMHAGRRERDVVQHQGFLGDWDVEVRNGVPVTAAARTVLDITTIAATEPSLVVVNYFLHRKLTTVADLRKRYAAMANHPNTLRTDLVLRLADPRGRIESVAESRTFFLCWRQGLPAPEPQWVLADGFGRELARLDFAWPEYGVWLEFDGREKYVKYLREGESIQDAVLREKQRESMISELTGWRCIRITWADLQNPVRTAARIRAILGLAR